MTKKILTLGVMVIMALGLFTGCADAKGSFYSLQEAFDNGWLSHEDLLTLAYYWNDGSEDENFIPKAISPESLDEETEKMIKKTHFSQNIVWREHPFATWKGVSITNYFGIYNNSIIVGTEDEYRQIDILYLDEYNVDGVLFHNFAPALMRVWRENVN